MYEVDFTGWTRTPEELEKIKTNWRYRLKRNWAIFYGMIKYERYSYNIYIFSDFWYYFSNLIFNKNNF